MRRPVYVFVLGLLAVASCKTNRDAPREERTVTKTPSKPDVHGEEVSYEAGGTALKGYLAWDASQRGPRPGVIVVHEWWGHNDYVRRRARMLAEQGYAALALDMYGAGKLAQHPEDAQKFMMEAISQADVARARFMAGYELLKKHEVTDPTKVAAIGYCFGGAVVLQMARLGTDLDGVASFHGTLAAQGGPAAPGTVKAKVLVLHGAEDPLIPNEQVVAFKKEMDAARVDYTFIEYPGAKHAFTNPAATEKGKKFGMPLAYDENADEQSWAELLTFLQGLFGESRADQ
jgi:dienelactone hydrolase